MRGLTVCLLSCLAVAPAQADEDVNAFVDANVLSIFYHELGHAVIHLLEVPIFGQEEDAADMMSVLLIDALYDEETAQALAYDSAFGYINDPERTQEVAYWDVHGPDEQRFYNHVCNFYGANPDERSELAEELGLPEERADTCEEEFELAIDSWGPVFDDLASGDGDGALRFEPLGNADFARVEALLQAEVEATNRDFAFPEDIILRFEECGEANAFYDLGEVSITICSEFVTQLEDVYAAIFTE
ncbi:MAG: DUF4344 domain-containing metallopeptidase [Pseudomonadota bacterium]